MVKLPEHLTLQAQVQKNMTIVLKCFKKKHLLIGFCRSTSIASLLEDGYEIRLTGKIARGTFAHRHAVLHDQKLDATYVPLNIIYKKPILPFIDSTLSEEAVLGFEYGFATTDPETLVIWKLNTVIL